MNCTLFLEKVKEQYEMLTKVQKFGISILIIGLLCIVSYSIGRTWGEAFYYIIN